MRLHVLSDLHIEFDDFEPPETSADVVVLAGDTHVGVKGIEWAAQAFPDKPILYVPGNHEFYRQAIPKHIHWPRDYRVGSTRVLANPRGYPGELDADQFDAGMVVEVA